MPRPRTRCYREGELAHLANELGLHELAVEDALTLRQRPKLDRYPDHLFLSAYSADYDPGTSLVTTNEVAAFITGRVLVTVHTDPFDIDAVVPLWDSASDLARNGVAFLPHGLLDHLVDGYFVAVEELDDRIEELENQLFLPNTKQDQMGPYLQDVYDHVLRVMEWTESLRDQAAALLEANLAIRGNRLNAITKKVTGYAAIIAVPTAITGFYGQNVPYPGFGEPFGYYMAAALIVGLSALLYVLFKRNDWI